MLGSCWQSGGGYPSGAKIVTRRFMSWLQRLCPQIMHRYGWKTVLIAFYLLYSMILFNKIQLSFKSKKKKKTNIITIICEY